MDFGEFCNEFECISSTSVESTGRQLIHDILELRQGNRALRTFVVSVKYKDLVRSVPGRDKYKRPCTRESDSDEFSYTSVQQMVMLPTSVLNIKWTLRGKPKSPIFSIGKDSTLKVNAMFSLNQISGQIEHQEFWDLLESSPIAQAYFWISRRLFATIEAGKDVFDSIKDLTNCLQT